MGDSKLKIRSWMYLRNKMEILLDLVEQSDYIDKEMHMNGIRSCMDHLPEFTENNMHYLNFIHKQLKVVNRIPKTFKGKFDKGLLHNFVGVKFTVREAGATIYTISSLIGEEYWITYAQSGGVKKVPYSDEKVLDYLKDGSWIIVN